MSLNPRNATILLVDDEPNITDALKRALRREPYEFLTATSGAAALQLLERLHVDVVVSDEQMPGMSGSEFLAIVRKQFPDTIRMILSGQASLEAAVRAINEGEVYRFFLKPCNPTDLIFTIQQALAHKRLEEQSRRLLREYQRQAAMLAKLNHNGPDLLRLDTDEQGAVVIDDSDGDGEVTDLLAEIELAMQGRRPLERV
ncbi:MAG TPA: response regulator [Steroidobacteraceae bacterium]|jgi:DNA-binding NtrC family response regulator|nr:response regulator [Steroidobacteraceae bacterium]